MNAFAVTTDLCRRLGYRPLDVRGRSRARIYVDQRQRVATELRKLGFSLNEIGHAIGGRDHSTVMYLLRRGERSGSRVVLIPEAGVGL